jgi:hypothetical protein
VPVAIAAGVFWGVCVKESPIMMAGRFLPTAVLALVLLAGTAVAVPANLWASCWR